MEASAAHVCPEYHSPAYIGKLGHDGVRDQVDNGLHDIGCGEGRVLGESTGCIRDVRLGRILDERQNEGGSKETVVNSTVSRPCAFPIER